MPCTWSVEYSTEPAETVGEALIRAVASTADTEPLGLPPLASVVDPDALDTLISTVNTDCCLSFVYDDHAIEIEADGTNTELTVTPKDE